MKVIDLLNKIANGEQPQHIRAYNRDWYWNNFDGYVTKESLKTTPDAQIYLFSSYRLDFALNKEVEIIEEDKKIEKILKEMHYDNQDDCYIEENDFRYYTSPTIINKINKLIEEVNKLKAQE